MIESINPTTGETIEKYPLHTDLEVENIIDKAHKTYLSWRNTSFDDRAQLMNKAAQILKDNKQKYAETMTREMGKTLKSAISEVEKCALVCEYYAENAEQFLADEIIESDAQKSMAAFRPLGVILAVMPWNFPLWQVFRFAAPSLMAGNVGILKHASNVPASALIIQQVFDQAGFPKNAFTTLLIKSDQVEKVIQNKHVRAATLTGSEPAGSAVAATAGKLIKPTVLELGGSDPYLILEDADLEYAAEQCSQSRLLNNGQSCIGAKRFIVMEKVYDEFMKHFVQKMKAAKMGDPMKEDTNLGPMAKPSLRDDLHQQVQDSIEQGAKCILGGQIPDRTGSFYPATILTNIKPGMPAYEEEFFGPVASVFKVKTLDEAIHIANDTDFGLGAAVFTKNIALGEDIAKNQLEAGCCFVNHFVKSDPRLPFGGIKTSGYGRELSHYGIKEFVNIKTVYIK
ncbi:MAG: NAD-dependent succinate-semialdehyde dehydrogenase [Saprospiraceae bacterium]